MFRAELAVSWLNCSEKTIVSHKMVTLVLKGRWRIAHLAVLNPIQVAVLTIIPIVAE